MLYYIILYYIILYYIILYYIILYYLTEQSYKQSVLDRNVVMRRIPVIQCDNIERFSAMRQ